MPYEDLTPEERERMKLMAIVGEATILFFRRLLGGRWDKPGMTKFVEILIKYAWGEFPEVEIVEEEK